MAEAKTMKAIAEAALRDERQRQQAAELEGRNGDDDEQDLPDPEVDASEKL